MNEWMNESMTKVGIELLGQLKIVDCWCMCSNNSISCAAMEKVQRQCASHLMCGITCSSWCASVGRKPAPRRHVLPRCKSIPLNQHYGHASSDGKLGSFFSGPMLWFYTKHCFTKSWKILVQTHHWPFSILLWIKGGANSSQDSSGWGQAMP